ncbi:hypothetical protein N9L28_03205 [Luminiphilus sp.]|nr:hypothetical protein [Luminiphilus sp.]
MKMVDPVELEPSTIRLGGWGRVRLDSYERKNRYEGSVLASKLVTAVSGVTLQAHTYFDERAGQIRDITHRRLINFVESLRALNAAQDPVTLTSNFCTMPDGSLGMEG